MDDPVVTSRQPIANLKLPENSECAKLYDKFDMYREVSTGIMRDALCFGYLEHLFRVSTQAKEVTDALKTFPRSLQNKLSEFISLKEEILQESLHILDTKINKEDLKLVKINLLNISYKWDGKKLITEEIEEGKNELLPVCYTLMWRNKYYLLYTPNMSYVDGYDSFTGNVNIPVIPDTMMEIMTNGFYQRVNSRAIQTEQRKKKKKNEENEEEDEKPVKKNEEKVFTMNSQNEENSIKAEEPPKMLSFLVKAKEKMDSDHEDEEDKHSEKSSDSDKPPPPKPVIHKQPVERTWEKYERKAASLKKERDQCGPGDCIII